jgi:hypothetical protein
VDRDTALTRAYHRLLVWDLVERPWLTRTAERLLDPVLGKSLVLYADKPGGAPEPPAGAAAGQRPAAGTGADAGGRSLARG